MHQAVFWLCDEAKIYKYFPGIYALHTFKNNRQKLGISHPYLDVFSSEMFQGAFKTLIFCSNNIKGFSTMVSREKPCMPFMLEFQSKLVRVKIYEAKTKSLL